MENESIDPIIIAMVKPIVLTGLDVYVDTPEFCLGHRLLDNTNFDQRTQVSMQLALHGPTILNVTWKRTDLSPVQRELLKIQFNKYLGGQKINFGNNYFIGDIRKHSTPKALTYNNSALK